MVASDGLPDVTADVSNSTSGVANSTSGVSDLTSGMADLTIDASGLTSVESDGAAGTAMDSFR